MYPPSADAFPVETAETGTVGPMRAIDHYRSAIRWSVDHFFRQIIADNDLQDTLLLYTSDHGQTFRGGSLLSHCNVGAAAQRLEAAVPLFTISTDGPWASTLSESAILNFDQASHFQVFPTLLLAFGYEPTWVSRTFGPSLLERRGPGARRLGRRPGGSV